MLEDADGWAWGQARRDGYVGFVAREALAPPGPPPTHRVAALRAYAFAEPDIKSLAIGPLSINALVAIKARQGRFALAAGLGWMIERQLAPIGWFEADFSSVVAERFVGAAYLWGGREAEGVDCSGLVQQAMFACGKSCPRDTEQQQALGSPVTADDLRRGDLVFWRGHVAIMIDAERIVHAPGDLAGVLVEPVGCRPRRGSPSAGSGAPIAYRRPLKPTSPRWPPAEDAAAEPGRRRSLSRWRRPRRSLSAREPAPESAASSPGCAGRRWR